MTGKSVTRVRVEGDAAREIAGGRPLADLAPPFETGPERVVGALVDGVPTSLAVSPPDGADVRWVRPGSREGIRFIRRSLSCLLVKAARDLFASARLVILHSLSKGLFCELHREHPLRRSDVDALAERMAELLRERVPFEPVWVAREEAISRFEAHRPDLVRLFRNRDDDGVCLWRFDDLVDFFHGPLVPDSGYVGPFELRFHAPGFLLRYPSDEKPDELPEFVATTRLGKVFYEFKQWSQVLSVPDVGALNEVISSGDINDFVRVAEALHEKRIAQIADRIDDARDRVRLILIAGPSASGKTTFAQRLAVQLRVNGMRPIPISLDDYYVERDRCPRDAHGEYDYESVEALDVELLNDHLQRLTWGEAIELPRYDFKTGTRAFRSAALRLEPGQVLICEGIHALNERLSELVPKANKFKIYVSALTQLNVDDHNRVPTTDTRLIRRIARDIQFRGIDVRETLARWRAVRRGEDRNIFPFQEEADVMFNSGLFYELCVLRGLVAPLLEAVPLAAAEYTEARRLLDLLINFRVVGTDEIPPNSILREFIGATCFFRAE
jgi:uridine kinase